jgi:hypothetical protein
MNSRNEKLEAYLNAAPLSSLEATRKFLRMFCSDADGIEEVKQDIARAISINPRITLRGLAGIEDLVANPPDDETLVELVAWEANWGLEDHSPSASLLWLQEMSEHIRDVLGDKQPPRTTSSHSSKTSNFEADKK